MRYCSFSVVLDSMESTFFAVNDLKHERLRDNLGQRISVDFNENVAH